MCIQTLQRHCFRRSLAYKLRLASQASDRNIMYKRWSPVTLFYTGKEKNQMLKMLMRLARAEMFITPGPCSCWNWGYCIKTNSLENIWKSWYQQTSRLCFLTLRLRCGGWVLYCHVALYVCLPSDEEENRNTPGTSDLWDWQVLIFFICHNQSTFRSYAKY